MFTGRRSTLLLALLACFQLVLGPALRPVACGMSAGGGGGAAGCCSAVSVALPEVDVAAPQDLRGPGACCCDGGTDADVPESADPDRGASGGDCDCVHAPQPSAPLGDPEAREASAPTVAIVPRAVRIAAVGSPARAPCEARAGPPGRAGPALHVLHCVFLI